MAAAPISVQYLSRLHDAVRRARDTDLDTLAHYAGAQYAQAVGRIRAAIPEDGAYALVTVPGPLSDEARKIVRYHLAPRRAVYVGPLGGTKRPPGVEVPPLAVIARLNPGPEIVASASVLPPR